MRMCIVQCRDPKRSAKGFNLKEDDRALPLQKRLLYAIILRRLSLGEKEREKEKAQKKIVKMKAKKNNMEKRKLRICEKINGAFSS